MIRMFFMFAATLACLTLLDHAFGKHLTGWGYLEELLAVLLPILVVLFFEGKEKSL